MFEPVDEKEAGLMNVLQLAYIGDAVWEVFVRNHLIRKGMNVHHMHSECIRRVSAKAQAGFVRDIEDMLDPEEAELIRRGRNAHTHHPVPRNQNPEDYALATGFETLIGFLHLTGKDERIAALAAKILGGEENG
jgi:ribonuclease-3 family protein